jgi:hypothetical protein
MEPRMTIAVHAASGAEGSLWLDPTFVQWTGDDLPPPTATPPAAPPEPVEVAQQPPTAARIRELTSISLTDWFVTRDEQAEVVRLLRADPGLDATVRDLASDPNLFGASSLTAMLKRVSDPDLRRQTIDILARGVDETNAGRIRRELNDIDIQVTSGMGGAGGASVAEQVWQVRFNLVRAGVPSSGPVFDRRPFADLVSSDPSQPFTGAGASGINPTRGSMDLGDQWRLLNEDANTTARYSNPIPGSLPGYLSGLSEADRARQAELFLRQPISSPMVDVWGTTPPTRAEVIEAAARRYNLDPATLAAFLLAEQRDQSRNEDLKDIAAATNAGHNSSIGLGQVVISTARDNQLFNDAVSPEVMRQAGTRTMTRFLSDDAMNIFAAARYIRQVADQGAGLSLAELEARTRAAEGSSATPVSLRFPGFEPTRYSGNSRGWGDGNIAALASEYTSRAWDGRWSPGWGPFVVEARRDVLASGVFGR